MGRYSEILDAFESLASDKVKISLHKMGNTPLLILKYEIGEGERVYFTTHGIHGDEKASSYSFVHSMASISERYADHLDKFKVIGILCNPCGIDNDSREFFDLPDREKYKDGKDIGYIETDLNRIWNKNPDSMNKGARSLYQVIDNVLRENNVEFHVDHHNSIFGKAHILLNNKHCVDTGLLYKVDEFFSRYNEIGIFNRGDKINGFNNIKSWFMESSYNGSTIDGFISKKGIPSLTLEVIDYHMNVGKNKKIGMHVDFNNFMIDNLFLRY